MARWNPNTRPRASAGAKSASMASRGAPRIPFPRRSENRMANTCGHAVAKPISGRTAEAMPYPSSTSFFCERQRSASHPDRIFSALLAASAAPSITPSDMAPAPSTCVRNSGSSGYTVSLAMSVKKLTQPRSQTGRERPNREGLVSAGLFMWSDNYNEFPVANFQSPVSEAGSWKLETGSWKRETQMNFDAVLIVAFGGPQGRDDVRPFLANVLRGRRVPPSRVEE